MFQHAKQHFSPVLPAQAAHFLIVMVLLGATQGCTPAFNWREVSFDGLPVSALLPCKPDRGTRSVPLAGAPREMVMAGCQAGGATFTVAVVNAGDTAAAVQVTAALKAANQATHSQYANHGALVVQASIYGTPQADRDGPGALSTQAVDTFFSNIKLAGKP
jgi:hypothetical protein